MSCIHFAGGIICMSPFFRLRLADGRCVFMEWHSYLGPTIYRDRACSRQIDDWYDDVLICEALTWFVNRGEKA